MTTESENLSREDAARLEMSLTAVSPAVASGLISVFLAILLAVPLIQHTDEFRQYSRKLRASRIPQCYGILPALPEAARVLKRTEGTLVHRTLSANRSLLSEMKRYETTLEENSWLTHLSVPWGQYAMTRWLGMGNEKTHVSRNGWLFYRPDVDHVTGHGFLQSNQLRRRMAARSELDTPLQPDPLVAITDFNRQLKVRGIRLIVMPIPAKPTAQPSQLHAGYPPETQPQNPSYDGFIRKLREQNVLVFDGTDLFKTSRDIPEPYLKQDTHWRPETAALAADRLASLIREKDLLPDRAPVAYHRLPIRLSSVGDTVTLLRLPKNHALYPLEQVRLLQVHTSGHQLWSKSEDADVLVLGDSFSNIFSLPTLGWGSSAGLAEQLSFFLQRPVDRITLNDNGSFATRQELAREIATGKDRLAGKKVVIWQFAARELSFGNWLLISL